MLNFKNVKILKTHNTLHNTVQSHLTFFYCNKKDSFDSLINTGKLCQISIDHIVKSGSPKWNHVLLVELCDSAVVHTQCFL